MSDVMPPVCYGDAWYFFAGGKKYGPYGSEATAIQRREDYLAFAVQSGACGQASREAE